MHAVGFPEGLPSETSGVTFRLRWRQYSFTNKSGTIFRLQVPLAARRIKSTEVQECQFSFDYAVPTGVAFPDNHHLILRALDVPRGKGVLRAVFPELDLLEP